MKVTPGNLRAWEKLGQRGSVFNYALIDCAKTREDFRVLSADMSLLSGMDKFIRSYKDKFLQVGIAEQNMMGIAAGLAMEGETVIASTYCSFIAVRCLEQIRQNISNNNADVKIIGTFAGVVAAKSGISHWATEDIAFMRALPNMTVLSPADSLEALKCFEAMMDFKGPTYLRLSGGLNCPMVYKDDYDFAFGKIYEVKEGCDVAIIATGLMVSESLRAADILNTVGISAAVYDVHTIKPIDNSCLDKIFDRFGLIATVEEHSVIGGLGGAVAEYKATKEKSPRQIFFGFNDSFTDAGSQRFIWDIVGITGEKIAERIKREMVKDEK